MEAYTEILKSQIFRSTFWHALGLYYRTKYSVTKMFALYTFPSISALPLFCFFRFPLLFFTRFSITHCQFVPQQSVSVSGLLWVFFLWIWFRIIFFFILFCQRQKKKISTTFILILFFFLNLVRIKIRIHLGLFLHYFKKVSDNTVVPSNIKYFTLPVHLHHLLQWL